MYDHKYTTYIEDESFAQIRIPHEHLTERQNSTSEYIIIVLYIISTVSVIQYIQFLCRFIEL